MFSDFFHLFSEFSSIYIACLIQCLWDLCNLCGCRIFNYIYTFVLWISDVQSIQTDTVVTEAGSNLTLACPGATEHSLVSVLEWYCHGCSSAGVLQQPSSSHPGVSTYKKCVLPVFDHWFTIGHLCWPSRLSNPQSPKVLINSINPNDKRSFFQSPHLKQLHSPNPYWLYLENYQHYYITRGKKASDHRTASEQVWRNLTGLASAAAAAA